MWNEMVTKIFLVIAISFATVHCACERDRNVQIKDPMYLNFGDGFFYIQGLTNGESVVMYKHPDDNRVFGQYTFKDEKCLYETVYYYVLDGIYDFTNPYITNEASFNVSNKINFVKHGNYEISYNISPAGVVVSHNMGVKAELDVLPSPSIKKVPAPGPVRQLSPNFSNIGKQNLKVSYLGNGENHIQFITTKGRFSSIEGQYTFRTSDRKYHSITYEIPLGEIDYNGITIKEYEMSTEENFFKSGTLRLDINGTNMDVRYFVNSKGFHVNDLKRLDENQRPIASVPNPPQRAALSPLQRLLGALQPTPVANAPIQNRQALGPNPVQAQNGGAARPINRIVRNQADPRGVRPLAYNTRILNPSFSRPDLLTGNRSVQPGRK